MNQQPQAILVAIGDELLLGATQDTNTRFGCQVLGALGVQVRATYSVRDDLDDIARLLKKAFIDAEIVITSGGLGPTADDLTREAVSRATGKPLERREELLDQIRARYAARGREMPPANERQADMPLGAEAIENPYGTAPGFVVHRGNRLVASLPGVPFEYCNLLEGPVAEAVRAKYAGSLPSCSTRNLLVTGVAESLLDERVAPFVEGIENPRVGVSAKPGAVTVRLVARGEDPEQSAALADDVEGRLREVLGPDVCEGSPGSPEDAISARCKRVAVADAVSGGHVSGRLYDAGVSVRTWAGGVDDLRAALPALGDEAGAVEAAAAAAALAKVDAAIALWPGEAGFFFVAAVLGEEASERVVVPAENPRVNRRRCEGAALDLLRRLAEGKPPPPESGELEALASMAEQVERSVEAAEAEGAEPSAEAAEGDQA